MITRAGFIKRMAFVALASGLLGTELVSRAGEVAPDSGWSGELEVGDLVDVEFLYGAQTITGIARITEKGPGHMGLRGENGMSIALEHTWAD